MSNATIFTCVTCNVAFNTFELQRDHYKTDWHRYNLKRKIAELPSVSLKDYQERLQIQKNQNESAENPTQEEMFCKLCCKHFSTANSFANHLNSKKHKELSESMNEDFAVKSDRNVKREQAIQAELAAQKSVNESIEHVETMEGDEKDWEDMDEEEMNDIDESKEIDVKTCLFCSHVSDSAESKCEHMAHEHSFFIPDMDYVSDLEGLLRHLGVKVGAYHVCLWCSSKCYRSLDAVLKHMSDKGHQKMKFEGETLLEYADFYTYEDEATTSVNDDSYDIAEDFDIKTISRISTSFRDEEDEDGTGEDTYELVLPSGAKIGHRSLFKYYKQSFGHRNLELKKKANLTVRDKYKAIAYGENYSVSDIQKQRKDLAYFQRWSARMHAKLGWESNKLQKHFRRQDLCF